MREFISYAIVLLLAYLCIRIIIRDSIKNIYNLICRISEDINEIKEKLGLEISHVPPEDEGALTRTIIKNKIFEGKIKRSQLHKELGFWSQRKHYLWIAHCISKFYEMYPRTKRCPECKAVVSKFFDMCQGCNVKVINDWIKK